MKLYKTEEEVKQLVEWTEVPGVWSQTSGRFTYHAETGAIANFWLSTHTIQFQGPAEAAEEFELKFKAALERQPVDDALSERRIWKYLFGITDDIEIQMAKGAEVLKVECQNGHPCIWALVDPSERTEARKFRLYGTGHPIKGTLGPHVGTFQQGPFVWHLFEDLPGSDESWVREYVKGTVGCLTHSAGGYPKHPLMLSYTTPLKVFEAI